MADIKCVELFGRAGADVEIRTLSSECNSPLSASRRTPATLIRDRVPGHRTSNGIIALPISTGLSGR
jgi:hypothetical protein